MTQTTTIAISITPLGKILRDYLSEKIFAAFLPVEGRHNLSVLTYFENLKATKPRTEYYKLLFASVVVFARPLFSFSRPFPFLSEEDQQKTLYALQKSRWHSLRKLFDFLKMHSLTAFFKDSTSRENWGMEESTTFSNSSHISLKDCDWEFDYIVIGNEGTTAAMELSKTGKKVLLLEQTTAKKTAVLKRTPDDFFNHCEISQMELEQTFCELENSTPQPVNYSVIKTDVHKILFEDHRAVAVETTMGTIPVKKGVVVSLDAIETPALFLRSGLKNPLIGKNLQAHISISCLGLLSGERDKIEGNSDRIEISQFEKNGIYLSSCQLPVEEMLSHIPFVGEDLSLIKKRIQHITSWMASIKTKAKGSVGITIKGKPHLFFTPSYDDMEIVRAAMNKLCQILFQLQAEEVYPGISGPLTLLKNSNQTGDVRALSPQAQYFKMKLLHQFGTCRVGTDPKSSVVDPHFRVRETENIYCTDTSVLPTSTGVDPTLTTRALSKIVCRKILQADAH